MLIFVVVFAFFVAAYLTQYSANLSKELELELGIVTPHKAKAFLVGYKVKDDPLYVIHVTAYTDPSAFLDFNAGSRILFVTPVLNGDQAVWFMRGYFKQARLYGFNSLYLTAHMRLSIALINDQQLQKELQLCM